jgi:hypothetical protein
VNLSVDRPDLGVVLQRVLPQPGLNAGLPWVGDNNSPQVRDRLFLESDFLDQAVMGQARAPAQRFVLGFEKTLFEQHASFEARLPLASSASTEVSFDSDQVPQEFKLGDTLLALKFMIHQGEVFDLSAGLGLLLPTGRDTTVSSAAAGELLHLSADALHLQPFVALAAAPTETTFVQSFLQFDYEPNGDTVVVSIPTVGTGPLGSLRAAGLVQWNLEAGWWVYRNPQPSGWVNAVAPFVQLDYATNLGTADGLSAAGLTFQTAALRQLDLAVGLHMDVCRHTSVLLGCVVPLVNQDRRHFDFDFSLLVNYHFEYLTALLHSPNF